MDTERTGIGANSLDTTNDGGPFFVSKSGAIVSKATSSGEVVGVSKTQNVVFASDNQTNAMLPLNYVPANSEHLYETTISGGSITIADEQYYFNLANEVTVDGISASTTTGQLRLIKFINATLGQFRIANK